MKALEPTRIPPSFSTCGGVLERVVGGVVGAEFGVEVAQDSDAHGVAHRLIVLEE